MTIRLPRKVMVLIGAVVTATVLATAGTALAAPRGPGRPPGPPGTLTVQLLAFNDFHGALAGAETLESGETVGGAAYVAGWIRELSEENRNTLVMYAGDAIGASPLLSALFHDEPTIEFMNLIGVDLASVGNHEFDEGVDELLRMANGGCHPEDGCFGGDGFAGAQYPYLAANVVDEDTGEPVLPPYTIKKVKGMRIGFIGLTLEETAGIVLPSGVEDVRFLDESETITRYVDELKRQGVESIVVVIHQGVESDSGPNGCTNPEGPLLQEMADSPAEVDAWVTGHTHDAYVCEVGGDPVTMAGDTGSFITEIDLVISRRTKDVVGWSATNHPTTHDVAPSRAAQQLVDRYRELSEEQLERVVGLTSEPILEEYDASRESPLGNLIADSQVAAAPEAVVAFMNPGGIRTDLDEGPVTYAEAFAILPFGNTLVTMDLTGAQILALLDEQWCGQEFPRVLQVSEGFGYTWRPGESVPCDERVIDGSVTIGGEDLDPSATYRVVTNNFLAQGGDSFETFTEGTNRVNGVSALEALVTFLPDGVAVDAPATDRIDLAGG